jgi:hypothetical protein
MKSNAAAVTQGTTHAHRFPILRILGLAVLWLILAILTIWALAALFVDVRISWMRIPCVVLYVAAVIAIFWKVKPQLYRMLGCLAVFCIVLLWWLSLKPSNEGNWQADVARTSWVEVKGDQVTIHNLRNCDYRTETDYSNCWSDRTLHLSQLRSVDLFFTTWGPPYIGHPILSFQFGDHDHICFSIEARYKAGQSYSAILGFFRQYELIFVTADERDVIRLRTNYRKDEEVRMYRTVLSPEIARAFFFIYADYLNRLKDHPEWYNALTKNCTTTLDRQLAADMTNPQPWNYQILLNGTLDHLLYQRGRLVTGGLPFHELWEREHINAAGRAADGSPDWSALIRVGRVGF